MYKNDQLCPNCKEIRGMDIILVKASYSSKYLECPECEDEFDMP